MSAILAHLSDPHLPLEALPGLRDLPNKRAVSLLSWLFIRRHIHRTAPLAAVMRDIATHNPDALAITGDMTNLGTRAESAAAARWLSRTGHVQAVIPGNHDTLVREPWEEGPGLWSPYGGMSRPDEPLCLRVNDVALIGVSSAIVTPPFFASGRVSAVQLDRTARLLRETRADGLCRVVMIHHPPAHGLMMWHKKLYGITPFAEMLRDNGAEMVLHGHSHEGTLTTVPGTEIPLIGVTSASHRPGRSLKRAAGWNRITVTRDENAMKWDIRVEARRLAPDGQIHTFRTHDLTRPDGGATGP